MAIGFDIVIPDYLIKKITDADDKLKQLGKTADETQKAVNNAFKQMVNGDLDAFIKKLQLANTEMAKLGNAKIQTNATNTSKSIDEINKLITALEKLSTTQRKTSQGNKGSNSIIPIPKADEWNNLQKSIQQSEKRVQELTRSTKEYEATLKRIQSGKGGVLSTQDQKQYAANKAEIDALNRSIALQRQKQQEIITQNKAIQEQNRMLTELRKLEENRKSLPNQRKDNELKEMNAYYRNLEKESQKRAEREEREAKKREERNRKEAEAAEKAREREAKAAEKAAKRREDAERRAAAQELKRFKANTPKDASYLLNQKGNAKSLNELKAYANELKRTMNTLDPKTKQWKNLNKVYGETNEKIRRINQQMKGFQQESQRARGITEQLRRSLMLMFSLSQISGYIKKLVAVRGEFELQKRSLEAILQNKDEANEIWDKTVQLAIKSPFQIKELVSYTKQLAAYRVESEKLHDTTKMLADVSAGLGVDMQRLILAYGQVKAANYLRGTELRQFSEAGINILGELATYFSEVENRAISVGEVFQMVSKRMVSFADVEEVFKRITSEGGTFYNMQEIQAETLKGQISNLRDSLDVMLNDIGMSQEGVLKGAVRMARNLLDSWEKWGTWVIPVLTSFLAKWALVNVISKRNWIAMQKFFDDFIKGLKGVNKGFGMWNSWSLIIAAAVAIIWSLVNAIRAANKEARELSKIELTGIFEASKMSGEYARLANIVSDATKSYEEQKKALDTLKRTYKDILPDHLLEAQTIKEMAGNYDEATDAINNYINAQIKQKQISYIDEEYSGKTTKEADKLTSYIFRSLKGEIEGLKRTDVATIINESVRRLSDGRIAAEEYGKELEKLFKEYLGVEVNPEAWTFIDTSLGIVQDQTDDLVESVVEYKEKVAEVTEYKPRIGSGIVAELNNIKESYKQSAMDIEKYKKVISDKAKGSELVTDEQYQDAINNLNAIFEYAGKEAPNWAEIINEPFKLNKATIEANQSLWKKMIDDFKDKISTEDLFGRFTWFNKEDKDSITKAIDDATKDVEKFAGSEFQKEVNRIAIYVQDKMNKSFIGLQGLLPKETESREEYAKRLEEKIKEMEAGIAQQKIDEAKGGDLMNDKLAKQYEEQLPLLKEFYSYFYHKDEESGKSNKIFEERLRILREMYDAYKDLRQHNFDADVSVEGVVEKYKEAFKDAFGFDYSNWGNFFVSEEGYKQALKNMEAFASNAKDILKIDLEVGRITWDTKKAEQALKDKQLKDDVEKMFSDYESWLDIDKLGVSTEFAKALFNIESMDLETLKSELQKRQHEFLSLDMLDVYNNYLKKIKELEIKAQQERMNGYLEYTRTTISQRAQLELKAMRDLANARKDIQDEEVLSQVESGIQKKLSQDLDKLNWEAFKSSDVFVKIFNDLDNVSKDALESMIKQLNDYKDEWKNLPIQEMKEVATQLEKMEKALAIKKAGNSPFSYASIRTLGQQAKSREDVSNAQKTILDADKLLLKYKSQEESLQTINQLVNEKKDATQAIVEYNAKYGTNLKTEWADQQDILNMTKEQTNNLQKLAKKETERKKNAQGIVDANEAYLFALQKQHQYLGESLQMANDLYGAFENVLAVCDEWGAELDESVAIFAQAGMDMTNTVIQTIQLQIQLNIAAQEATGLGIAMNAAMGIIGWIVMAVQLLTTALSAIAKAHDNSLQKQIEHDAEAVELLQKRFDKLEKAIDNAMSFGQYQKEFDEAKRNLDEQIRLTRDMIALEEAKKKTDKDAIKGYKDEIEDYNEQLKEMEEKRISDMGGFGSDEAYKDAAQSFIDAWLSAYKETGDGLEALQGQWDEYFDNLVKKQMIMHIANKYIKGLLEQVDKAIGRDGIVTGDEMANLKAMAEQSSIEWNAIMKQFADAFGIEGLTDGTKLEGLSESIQGVTEVTAQALEAILNSMRFYVIDNNKQLIDIANTLLSWESPTSPILAELKAQTSYLSSIESLFNSVVDRNGSPAVRVR